MNEIDLTTKIEGLKKAIAEHKDFAGNYESDLVKAEQELKDYNKIALPPVVFDDIQEAIEAGIEEFDFSDTGNFDIEYGIEYDGKVHCESHELNDTYELTEKIVKKVHALFVEKLDTIEPDHHKPVETQPVVEEITVDGGETEVTVTPTEDEMNDFNKKIEETKEKSFKKRTWF